MFLSNEPSPTLRVALLFDVFTVFSRFGFIPSTDDGATGPRPVEMGFSRNTVTRRGRGNVDEYFWTVVVRLVRYGYGPVDGPFRQSDNNGYPLLRLPGGTCSLPIPPSSAAKTLGILFYTIFTSYDEMYESG